MSATVSSSADVKAKQVAYHDWEARTYDDKFSISYDERCIVYARERMEKVVDPARTFGRTLEVGAGTGFFSINLWQAGFLTGEVHVSDISPGMLEVCERNARQHGLDVVPQVGDVEALPYDDDRFDLVIGHAFLHHLPDPQVALAEMFRVLAPGGELVVAGEPTLWGDRIANQVKRNTYRAIVGVTALPGVRRLRKDPAGKRYSDVEAAVAALEHEVDLHTFDPDAVQAMARAVGFPTPTVVTEELVSNWMGWVWRTVEGSLRPGTLGRRWALSGYRGYLVLNALDEKVLGRLVPRRLFYNLILHAVKPPRPAAIG
ncbi:MAG TPA: methyltransferase domain-containing protein [Nitriliruptorales bacterium]